MAKKKKLTDIEQADINSINPVSPNPIALPELEYDFLSDLNDRRQFSGYNPSQTEAGVAPAQTDGTTGGISAIRNNGIGNSIRSAARSLADQINDVIQPVRDDVNEGNLRRSRSRGLEDEINDAFQPVRSGARNLADEINDAFQPVRSGARNIADQINDAAQPVRSVSMGLADQINDAAQPVRSGARNLADEINDVAQPVRDDVNGGVQAVPPAVDESPTVARPGYTEAIAGGERDISESATEARKMRIMEETGMSESEYEQVRKQNLEDRRAYNIAKAQTMNQIRSLAAQARDLDKAGDAQAAGQVRAQIAQLRQAIDAEGRRIGTISQEMRGRISDLSPSEQIAAVERGRASLNAQLPTIARSAQEQADTAAAEQTSRLSDIGRKAFQLENGNLSDFAGMSDAAFAQYAQEQASPEAIMQATRGVGLPTSAAPGSQAFADRVGGMSSIDFGTFEPRSPSQIDASAINDALSISSKSNGSGPVARAGEQFSAGDSTRALRDYARQFPDAPEDPVLQTVASGALFDTIRNAAKEQNHTNIDTATGALRQLSANPYITQEVRSAIARDVAKQIEDIDFSRGKYSAAFKGLKRASITELGKLYKNIRDNNVSDIVEDYGDIVVNTEFRDSVMRMKEMLKQLDPSITLVNQ